MCTFLETAAIISIISRINKFVFELHFPTLTMSSADYIELSLLPIPTISSAANIELNLLGHLSLSTFAIEIRCGHTKTSFVTSI